MCPDQETMYKRVLMQKRERCSIEIFTGERFCAIQNTAWHQVNLCKSMSEMLQKRGQRVLIEVVMQRFEVDTSQAKNVWSLFFSADQTLRLNKSSILRSSVAFEN